MNLDRPSIIVNINMQTAKKAILAKPLVMIGMDVSLYRV